tara:strand:+ start:99 stop:1040 length:942 start_codon:yes stop_codon:yes gene_type:complete
MAVKLSPLAGAGWQFFDNLGIPLAGGLLYTYTAGTTTPQATYTSNAGTIANANPIVLDAAGRTANEVWLTVGVAYKFVLQTPAAVTIGTYDNVSGINDSTGATTLGTVTTGVWNATPIGAAYGGTGLTSIAARSVPVANVANTYTTVTPAAGQSIRINAGNTAWEAYTPGGATSVGLSAPAIFTVTNSPVTSTGTLTLSYSGTALPPANGGTGLTAVGTTGNVLTSDGTAWVSSPVTIPTSGGVGTIIFAQYSIASDITFGSTVAAAFLSYSNAGGTVNGAPSSGTWKCLGGLTGATSGSVGVFTTSLWVRTI